MTDLSIAILCGGDSSRFGEDKTLVEVDGVPLYKLVWSKLEKKSDDVFLQIDPKDEYDLPARPDLVSETGPLGAIYSALTHAEHDWLFVSACDLPYLDTRIVEELYSEVESETEAVIPRWKSGYLEPLTALYHKSVLPRLKNILEGGTRKITDFLDRLDEVKEVSVEGLIESGKIPPDCFYNVNTQEDLEDLDIY
ncbi:molybdenum cofactor guanylyltransferase [Candidatus Bipolaricaulota bacterium]|nr:molybdenum cofactor guanylyltransferase [Candidatus Bipolaricaulota bacterium]